MALAGQALTPVKYPHIIVDAQGIAHIEGSRSKVYQIVIDHTHVGLSPAQIHEYYPHLSLAQIHSALTYYYDHKEEIDADIERRRLYVEKMQAEATDQFTRAQLEERLRQKEAAGN